MDGALRLGSPHLDEALAVGYHFTGCDKESRKFRFSSRSHNKLDDLGNGENGTIESRKKVIHRKIDKCTCLTARLGFVEEASIGMRTQNHVTSTIDDAIIWISGNIVR